MKFDLTKEDIEVLLQDKAIQDKTKRILKEHNKVPGLVDDLAESYLKGLVKRSLVNKMIAEYEKEIDKVMNRVTVEAIVDIKGFIDDCKS